MKTRKARKIFSIISVFIILWISARLISRQAAIDYGKYVSNAYAAGGFEYFSRSDNLSDLFKESDLKSCEKRTEILSILGGEYDRKIKEVKLALNYLANQASLPDGARFDSLPELEYFKISGDDKSIDGINGEMVKVILMYRNNVR